MIRQPRNAHQWKQFQAHWRGIEGIDAAYLGYYSNFDGAVEELNRIGEELARTDPDQAAHIRRQKELAQYPCYYPWHSVSVTWEGKVVPCCRDYDESLVLGDLRRESLEAVWNGPRLRRLRRDLRAARFPKSLCASCNEPSLEIGLPGRHYPLARWMRKWGMGKLPGASPGVLASPDTLTGSQSFNRAGLTQLCHTEVTTGATAPPRVETSVPSRWREELVEAGSLGEPP
jgi:radical SAM protein with 4Fe4S-binding SPASM domain